MASCIILRALFQHQLPLQISKSSYSLTSLAVAAGPTHRCFCSQQRYRSTSLKPAGDSPWNRPFDLVSTNRNNSDGRRNYGSIYEPDYLDTTGPEVPIYDVLNIQVRGYDFSVLEKFAKYVHHTAERIGLSVDEAWATPGKKLKVTKLKPESSLVETEFSIVSYERNVQIVDVPATLLPVFINVVEACIPAGVSLRIHPHLQDHTELRYVPDLQLKELRTQLGVMRGEKKEK